MGNARSRVWLPPLALGVALCCAGCSQEHVARKTFSTEVSCPMDKVSARERPDLSAHELTWGKKTPPKDIAKDPERLAVWRENNEKDKRNSDARSTVFSVEGCGEKRLYKCSHNGKSGRNSCMRIDPRDD